MADISKLTLPSGTTYNIKDAKAREDIASIEAAIAGGVSFIGETTTAISDGSTTNPIVINGNNHTAISGNLVVYGSKEFIFDGTKWIEFGDLGTLKALAFKDSASGSYTPQGTVSAPTFTGSEMTVAISATAATGYHPANFTPSGAVSQPTFTGSNSTFTGSYTPSGSVSVSTSATTNKTATVSSTTGTATYTPGGTVSQPTFTGSNSTFTGSYTPSGTVDVSTSAYSPISTLVRTESGAGTYTPSGTVSQPTFTGSSTTFTGSYTPSGTISFDSTWAYVRANDVNPDQDANYQPKGEVTLVNENKTIAVSSTTGTATYTPSGTVSAPTISVATAGATTTIKNPTSTTCAKTVAVAAPGATAPANNLTYYAVSGETLSLYQIGYTTGAAITTSNVTVKTGDAAYSATAPTFTGSGARLVTASVSIPSKAQFSGQWARIEAPYPSTIGFTGSSSTISVSGTPSGTVSKPTFTGTGARLVTETFSIPAGFSATFTGTAGTVSVSGTPSGSVSQPTFTGSGARLVTGNIAVPNTYTATFTGTAGTVSVSGTPSGTVSKPTFTGSGVYISGTGTPSGTVSTPTFTGTAGTITVS